MKILPLALAVCVLTTRAQNNVVQVDTLGLRAEISQYGDVILNWDMPQGVAIGSYEIYRGDDTPNSVDVKLATLFSSTTTRYTDPHDNVVAGRTYWYTVKAFDRSIPNPKIVARQQIEVDVTPPSGSLSFTSTPVTTAYLDSNGQSMYLYVPRVNVAQQSQVELSLGGPYPSGMSISFVGGSAWRIDWSPRAVGQYPVTIVAKHKTTGAIGVQEFTITVTDKPGTVLGTVKSLEYAPLAGTVIRIFQVADAMTYETVTDANGAFVLNNVQSGEIYAYARPASDRYAPQWYSLGASMDKVNPRSLRPHDTLRYEFYMLTATDQPTTVHGVVRASVNQTPIGGAEVSFIRRNRFIQIGDPVNVSNPGYLEGFAVDTTVTTAADGTFSANLRVGTEYYSVVKSAGFETRFMPEFPGANPTNALQARPFTVRDGLALAFPMQPMPVTENRIVGSVRNASNGINKEAVVILIDPELSRGAGGGNTYHKYSSTLSDESGSYRFDNLSAQSSYSVLAIPLERNLAPEYFTYQGGTTQAAASSSITAYGTVQNVDFDLKPTNPSGVGTIYGQVVIIKDGKTIPGVGTLVLAQDDATKEIFGYAVSDSAGWYSIPGLPSGHYDLFAENLDYGSAASPTTALVYTSYNIFTSTKVVNFTINAITAVDPASVPKEPALFQNYPNPFNPATTISYFVPRRTEIALAVFDSYGRLVRTLVSGTVAAGEHNETFDAGALPSGTYYVRMVAGSTVLTRSMTLLK